jgi:hypothetical protein
MTCRKLKVKERPEERERKGPAIEAIAVDENGQTLDLEQTASLESTRPQLAHAGTSSPAARPEFQSVSSEASLPFLEDVNRARLSLNGLRRFQVDDTAHETQH